MNNQQKALIRLYQNLLEQEQDCLSRTTDERFSRVISFNQGMAIGFQLAAKQVKSSIETWFDIQILPLVETQTYLEQVAEECKHDCDPDREERDHIEEIEYRSMQMGFL